MSYLHREQGPFSDVMEKTLGKASSTPCQEKGTTDARNGCREYTTTDIHHPSTLTATGISQF